MELSEGESQVVAVLLGDSSTVAVLQQQKPHLPDVQWYVIIHVFGRWKIVAVSGWWR